MTLSRLTCISVLEKMLQVLWLCRRVATGTDSLRCLYYVLPLPGFSGSQSVGHQWSDALWPSSQRTQANFLFSKDINTRIDQFLKFSVAHFSVVVRDRDAKCASGPPIIGHAWRVLNCRLGIFWLAVVTSNVVFLFYFYFCFSCYMTMFFFIFFIIDICKFFCVYVKGV